MTELSALWLPILLSSVIVFVVSSVIHMAPLWHKNDYPRLANEDQVLDALRSAALPPGDYLMPRPASREAMRSPEFAEKLKRGPILMMTVMASGGFSMAKNMVSWFVYVCVVGILSAYVAGRALPVGAPYPHVFRFAGTTAFIAYSAALWQMSIWLNCRSIATLFLLRAGRLE